MHDQPGEKRKVAGWQAALHGLAARRGQCPPENFNRHFSEEIVSRQDDQEQLDFYYRPTVPAARRRIERFLRALPPGGGLTIDLGTGVGTMVYQLSSAGGMAFGFDYSPTSLHTAGRLHQRLKPPGSWGFAVADTGALPLAAACADLVTMADFVEHLTPAQKERTLGETVRILRPGGRVIIGTPNLLVEKRTEWLDRYWHRKPPDLTTLGHIGLIDPWRMCRQMRAHGLTEVKCTMFVEALPGLGWLLRLPRIFAGACALAQWLPGLRLLLGNYFIAGGRKPGGGKYA